MSFQSQDASSDNKEENCKLSNKELVLEKCYVQSFNTKQKTNKEN